MMYVQCQLQKGETQEVIWIPEKFATVGKTIGRKINGSWDEGWMILATYSKLSEEAVLLNRDKHKDHRKATDI